jgi:hypothetical protein
VINAGWVTMNLVNRGSEPHQVQIARLEPGKTLDDVTAAFRSKAEPPWRLVGGPNAADPNARANATQYLVPGNYVLVCFIPSSDGRTHLEKGMVRPLRVRASGSNRGREPAADVSMRLVDYGFDLSRPLRPGRQTIRVWTDAPQPHEVVLIELEPGKTTQDFLRWADGHPEGPPPARFRGGVVFLHPREAAYFTVDLKPGRYGLICFYPDRKDGKPHFMHGMVTDITVQ